MSGEESKRIFADNHRKAKSPRSRINKEKAGESAKTETPAFTWRRWESNI